MRILLAEDDQTLNETLSFQLQREGFIVDSAFDGEEALFYIEQNIHDLILLDRMMPRLEGTEVLSRIRRDKNQTPVIFLTALGSLNDKVTGLDLGADDYLVKPFAFEELLARIRCVSRRPRNLESEAALCCFDLAYDIDELTLRGPSGSCSLSKREGMLLECFLRNPGQVLLREQLLTKVWGMDSDVEDGNLDNYIHFLRRRLKAVQSRAAILTIRGIGYRIGEAS